MYIKGGYIYKRGYIYIYINGKDKYIYKRGYI